jgi:hypothetical protein
VAQQVQTVLIDDISGREIPVGEGETITFAVNGVTYEIDLDAKSAKKFHDTLAFYIDHGRKIGRSNVSSIARTRGRKSESDFDPAAVRAWAESNGYDISPRGRIRGEILEAYRAAGN